MYVMYVILMLKIENKTLTLTLTLTRTVPQTHILKKTLKLILTPLAT